jgi:hypothetical protein
MGSTASALDSCGTSGWRHNAYNGQCGTNNAELPHNSLPSIHDASPSYGKSFGKSIDAPCITEDIDGEFTAENSLFNSRQ